MEVNRPMNERGAEPMTDDAAMDFLGNAIKYKSFVNSRLDQLANLLKTGSGSVKNRLVRAEDARTLRFQATVEAVRRFNVSWTQANKDLNTSSYIQGSWRVFFHVAFCRMRVFIWNWLSSDRLRALIAVNLRSRLVDREVNRNSAEAPETITRGVAGEREISGRGAGSVKPGPLVSIVVLSYRRPSVLRRTLRSLQATTCGANANVEIIVVDNESSDATRKVLSDALFAGVISRAVFCRQNIGISAGYNLGFSLASDETEFYTKLDHDQVLLTPGWIDKVTGLLSRYPCLGIVVADQVNHLSLQVLPIRRLDGIPIKTCRSLICGSTMTISKNVRERVLGDFLETDLKYFPDDIDYVLRANLSRLEPVYLASACSYHVLKDPPPFTQRSHSKLTQEHKWEGLLRRQKKEYFSGKQPLFIKYSRYRDIEFPGNQNTLMLDRI